MKINELKITKKLSILNIDQGSKLTSFFKRKDGKITGEIYLLSFFMMLLSGGTTLLHWTLQISKLVDGLTLTEQGLDKKLQFRQVKFAKWLLLKSIQLQLKFNIKESEANSLRPQELPLDSFNRILLQDSTCVNVPKNLSEFFPSSFTKNGVNATARIQLTIDLLSDNYESISLGSFRDNDASSSADILEMIQTNDLILRDKGYWSLDVFAALDNRSCYFLSRLKYGVNLYDVVSQEKIDLNKILKKSKKNDTQTIDKEIVIGANHQLKVRLIAIRLPEEVAAERRRKARQDRHSKTNHSKDYYERLGWCIFITNIPQKMLNAEQIVKVYRLRWHIEIIFKVWKSKFDFSKMFQKTSMKPSRAIITFYLLLAWLTLFFVYLYSYFLIKVFNKKKRFISIFNPDSYRDSEFLLVFMQDSSKQAQLLERPDDFIDIVASSCLYDKRSNKNQMELIYC